MTHDSESTDDFLFTSEPSATERKHPKPQGGNSLTSVASSSGPPAAPESINSEEEVLPIDQGSQLEDAANFLIGVPLLDFSNSTPDVRPIEANVTQDSLHTMEEPFLHTKVTQDGAHIFEGHTSLQTDPEMLTTKFLEVLCNSSGKVRRFAAGTEAGYALCLINHKLEIGIPQALHIEAVKEGEEPVSFGPNAILVSYGKDWKLQTVIEKGYKEAKQMQQILKKSPNKMKSFSPQSVKEPTGGSSSTISFQYVTKIVAAFVFIFLFGGVLTLFLENLPKLLLFLIPS